MPRKRLKIIAIALICIVFVAVGGSFALLTSVAGPVENVFTIGNIKLSLSETTGGSYKLIPGTVIAKDPTVKVEAGSEDCWLFIKVDKTQYFEDYISYQIDSGWTILGGYDGVYYRKVIKSGGGDQFPILADNAINVREDLTEEKMAAITALPKITFKAYAIQSHGIETANDAWHRILEEVEE